MAPIPSDGEQLICNAVEQPLLLPRVTWECEHTPKQAGRAPDIVSTSTGIPPAHKVMLSRSKSPTLCMYANHR